MLICHLHKSLDEIGKNIKHDVQLIYANEKPIVFAYGIGNTYLLGLDRKTHAHQYVQTANQTKLGSPSFMKKVSEC